MPIHHQEMILYSVEEISQTTNIPLEQIIQFIKERYEILCVIFNPKLS